MSASRSSRLGASISSGLIEVSASKFGCATAFSANAKERVMLSMGDIPFDWLFKLASFARTFDGAGFRGKDAGDTPCRGRFDDPDLGNEVWRPWRDSEGRPVCLERDAWTLSSNFLFSVSRSRKRRVVYVKSELTGRWGSWGQTRLFWPSALG